MEARVEPAATAKPKLAVRDLNFYYGGFQALKSISLDIPEKKVTSFIGPSGCGKSTLLRTFIECSSSIEQQKGRDRDRRQARLR